MRAEAWSVGSTASRKHCAGMSGDMLVCFTSPALLRIVRHSMLQPASQQSGSEQSCRPRAGFVPVGAARLPTFVFRCFSRGDSLLEPLAEGCDRLT
jgi:hypothetical protein